MTQFDPDPTAAGILVEGLEDAVVVRLRGEHDLASAPLVSRTIEPLLAPGGRPLVIDLAETTFIDSSILHALLAARRRAVEAHVPLGLAIGSHDAVRNVLELTNLLGQFTWGITASELRPLLATRM